MTRHIVHVLGGLDLGGTERLCLDVVRHAPSGVRNTIAVLDGTRKAMELVFRTESDAELIWPCALACSRLRFLICMWRLFGKLRPDGVIVYSIGIPQVLIGLAGRLRGVRVVAAAGNPPPASGRAGRWKWWLIVALSRVVNTPIQACSNAVEYALRGLGLTLPRGSGTIPNGCDVAGISKTADATRGTRMPDSPLIVGMVARLDEIKDQDTLIRAFALLRQETVFPTELWLVGEGPRRAILEELAAVLGVSSSVRFLGARGDVPALLGLMDLFAFSTSNDEGLGIALIEAMAAGLPVIASNVPACREVLDDGAAGILVPARVPQALAMTINRLLLMPAERSHWGKLGQARARAAYDARLCAAQWFDSVLPGRATLP